MLFEEKLAHFDPDYWKSRLSRASMVYDLIHSYHLIGVHRDHLYTILGKPEYTKDTPENKLDIYSFAGHEHCGNAGITSLEIAYINNRVHRLRLAYEEGTPTVWKGPGKVVIHTYYSRWLEANP